MSELRDRSAAFDDDDVEDYDAVPWNYKAIFGSFKGIPWWAAILCALVPAFIGAFIDINSGKVGWTFNAVFFLGALAGILLVQRRSLFAPMVQPPLILVATVPVFVLFTGGIKKGGLVNMAVGLGTPLVNSFPVMAVTTAVTVALGIVRIAIQKDPNRPSKDEVREAKAELKSRGKPAARKPSREPSREEPAAEERPRRPRPEGTPARRPRPEGAPARRPRPEGAARGERPAGQRKPRAPREDR